MVVVSMMEDDVSQDGFPSASTIVEEHALALVIETFLFALYSVLFVYLVCRRCLARKTTTLPTFMMPFMLSMFALNMVYWILDVYLLWAKYHVLHTPQLEKFDAPDFQVSSINEVGLAPQYFAPVYVQYIIQLMLITLGDFISLWRAYVIYGRPRWVYILLICIVVAESVAYILVFVAFSMEYLSLSTPVVIALASIRTPLTFIGYGIVGLAQLGSTGSIAYRAWIHWRDVREFLHHSTTTRRTIATMGIIIESGVTYLGLLLWYGAITWWGSPRSAVVYTCRFYSVPLIAMYPTLVVILVASRRSVLEGSTGSTLAAHVEEIRFTPNLADKRGCIRCATCVACAARSWSDNGGSGQVDSRRLEIGLDESMAMGNIVPAPNDNESHMSLEHGRSGSDKYRQVLLNGGVTTATHTVDLP